MTPQKTLPNLLTILLYKQVKSDFTNVQQQPKYSYWRLACFFKFRIIFKMLLLRLEVPKRSRPQDRSPTGPKCEMVRPYTLHIKMRSMQLGLVKWIQHPHLMLTIPSSIPATSLQIPSCLDLRLLVMLGAYTIDLRHTRGSWLG